MHDALSSTSAGSASVPPSDLLATLPRFAGRPATWWRDLPWSVTRDGDSLLLTLDHLREELIADRANRELVMACGAVIENLRVAAHHFGAELAVESWPSGPNSTTIARFTVAATIAPRREEEALFAILSHATPGPARRGGGATSPALVAVLRHAARSEGGWLDVVSDDARRTLVAELESEAAAITDAERGARRILSTHAGPLPAGAHFTMGGGPSLGELLATLGSHVQPSNEWSVGRAAAARGRAMEAPILAVLGANDDVPAAWLRAGKALQRVLLHASVQGLSATFLNEPLHHPLLRDAVRALLFAGGAPQAIVRFDFEANGSAHGSRHRGGSDATAA
jgi:hypothetical protein